ncbi:MAG: rod shape-determining protein RodA [Lentisphaeria bacterium]|nr:rod shape-determining protein RodA [Lentisphaeria bacterium]
MMDNSFEEGVTRRCWWLRADYLALVVEGLLLSIGVAFIYGAGLEVGGDLAGKWHKQLVWIGLGSILYIMIASIDYHLLARKSLWGYLFGVFLLLVVLLFGKTLNNTRGWLRVPGVGYLQPVELAKPLTLLFLSWLGTRPSLRNSRFGEWLPVLALFGIVMVPVGLICLQPDVGTGLVFFPFTLVLVFLTGLRKRWFVIGAGVLLMSFPLAYMCMKPYQKDRVKVFLETPARKCVLVMSAVLPESAANRLEKNVDEFFAQGAGEKKRDDWNAVQSMLAVGSGGLSGKGYLKGTQHVLGYLPKTIAPTDFIFSVIAEETGFLGGSFIIALYAVLMLCICRTAVLSRDRLGCFLAMGVAVIFATHIVINISMTIGAAPIVGIPLPFVSYGGSFMLGTMMLAGIVQSVNIHRNPSPEDIALMAANQNDEEEN